MIFFIGGFLKSFLLLMVLKYIFLIFFSSRKHLGTYPMLFFRSSLTLQQQGLQHLFTASAFHKGTPGTARTLLHYITLHRTHPCCNSLQYSAELSTVSSTHYTTHHHTTTLHYTAPTHYTTQHHTTTVQQPLTSPAPGWPVSGDWREFPLNAHSLVH